MCQALHLSRAPQGAEAMRTPSPAPGLAGRWPGHTSVPVGPLLERALFFSCPISGHPSRPPVTLLHRKRVSISTASLIPTPVGPAASPWAPSLRASWGHNSPQWQLNSLLAACLPTRQELPEAGLWLHLRSLAPSCGHSVPHASGFRAWQAVVLEGCAFLLAVQWSTLVQGVLHSFLGSHIHVGMERWAAVASSLLAGSWPLAGFSWVPCLLRLPGFFSRPGPTHSAMPIS